MGGHRRVVLLLAAAVLLISVVAVGPASAQYVGGTPPAAGPVVKPVAAAPSPATPVKVQVARAVPARAFALTGADIAQMVMLAGALVIGGTLLVRQGRRRAHLAS